MTDLSNIESAVKTAATAEVATVKSRVIAFVKTHVPALVSAVAGYAGGHYGLIGAVLKHLF
jgi:hypothetical protein